MFLVRTHSIYFCVKGLDNALYVGVAAVGLISWATYERLEDSQVTDFYACTPRQVTVYHPTNERVCSATVASLTSMQFKGSPAAFLPS